MSSVLQPWVEDLSMMQQSVLLTAVRGPDALPKYHPSKFLLRWYRRCTLLSAMDGCVLADPVSENGGSFTGPSVVRTETYNLHPLSSASGPRVGFAAVGSLRDRSSWAAPGHFSYGQPAPTSRDTAMEAMNDWVEAYLRGLDEVPHHYQLHFMHAVEIVGYKHPDFDIGLWWNQLYVRLARDMHLHIEPEEELDERLGDSREAWLEYADPATRT